MTDEENYRRYLSGDDGGLSTLMEKYGDRLTFYIDGYLHDIQESEDMMIEAFSRLIVKKPSIGEGCFKPYLFRIGRNLALRAASRQRLKKEISFESLPREPEGKDLAEEVVRTKERAGILRACMEELVPNHREALYLVYFERMSHAAAAIIMGKSEKQVADFIYRGKRALKSRLAREGLDDENE